MAKKPKKVPEVEVEIPQLPPVQGPIPFSAVIGQDRALGVLLDAVKSGRVHHAWIFHGPPGVGKFTTALAYAALLLDPTTQATFSGELAPDPDSQVQKLLGVGTHPDLHVITKETSRFHPDPAIRARKQSNIPVDVIRHFVVDPGKLGPTMRSKSAAGKIFIIDEAELLGDSSQNSVLKILEEPPERVVLILVTSSEDRLLPTIRSRCQRVFFAPLSERGMGAWLRSQGLEVPEAERAWLTRFADGSPGIFKLARESDLFGWWTRLEPMLRQAERGGYTIGLGPAMAEMIDSWAKAWVDDHDNASKEAANKAGADWMLRVLAGYLRERLRKAAAIGKAGPYLAALDALREAESEIDSNVNMLFVMEKVSSELSAAFGAAVAESVR